MKKTFLIRKDMNIVTTKINYFIDYEKFENKKAVFKDNYLEETNAGTEELI